MELVFFLIVITIGIMVYISWQKQKARDQAYVEYQDSLAQLKRDPGNSDYRQRTLALGRVYSDLLRDKKGNTVFDEVGLMNDINAACASTQHAIHAQATPSPPQVQSIDQRLSTLQSLRERGLIDDQDYQRRKEEILGSI